MKGGEKIYLLVHSPNAHTSQARLKPGSKNCQAEWQGPKPLPGSALAVDLGLDLRLSDARGRRPS